MFLARVKPVFDQGKPRLQNITKKSVMRVQTMLRGRLLLISNLRSSVI